MTALLHPCLLAKFQSACRSCAVLDSVSELQALGAEVIYVNSAEGKAMPVLSADVHARLFSSSSTLRH